MKLSGVRSDPLAGVRRRVALQSAAGGSAAQATRSAIWARLAPRCSSEKPMFFSTLLCG